MNFPVITKGFCISIDTLHPLWFMLLCCISCFLLIILRFIGGPTRRISTNPCLFLLYQLNIFRFTFSFVNYTVIYKTKVERLVMVVVGLLWLFAYLITYGVSSALSWPIVGELPISFNKGEL